LGSSTPATAEGAAKDSIPKLIHQPIHHQTILPFSAHLKVIISGDPTLAC